VAARIIDELKTIKQDIDESAIRKAIIDFFDEMDVDDVDKRTLTAISLEQVFRNIFWLALTGELAREELINRLITEYSMVIVASGYRANYEHIERVCEDVVDNTLEKIDTPYMTSTDRSILIAETETNNVANYDEYLEAKENGMTEKVWHTMEDNKVRQTHMEIDGATVGIDDLFQVGAAEMRFPCDEELAYDFPEEICGCRCSVAYQ
jgi:uncharacterized protein with gpF-like domain